MKLDIGCGQNKWPGFIGMDISNKVGAEIVHDWEDFPWPIASASIDEINASHVLEHTKDLINFMNECYRIMQMGAQMHVVCPYYSSIEAWQDPTHVRAISEKTFLYFNKEWRLNNGLSHYSTDADFDFNYVYLFAPEWDNKPMAEKLFGVQHYTNVCKFIQIILSKR